MKIVEFSIMQPPLSSVNAVLFSGCLLNVLLRSFVTTYFKIQD